MKTIKDKTIKVSKDIKPIHFRKRKPPELIIGNTYYLSFGSNVAEPFILLEIHEKSGNLFKSVSLGRKDNSERGYGNVNRVYSDEIGLTPEEAVINEMTL